MKFCKQCNDTYPDDANFCLLDGAELQSMPISGKRCDKCGKTYPQDAIFCMTDGELLSQVASPAATIRKKATKRRKTAKSAKISKTKRDEQPHGLARDKKKIFSHGLTKWFQNMGYAVGLSPNEVDTEKDLKFVEGLADTAETLLNFGSSMWITGGQGTEQFFRALVPYVPLCNLLGSKIELGAVSLVPVLYADELPPAIIEQRFEEFMDLAGPLTQFGPRLNLQAMGNATIFPLLIYFDSKKYSADLPEIMPDAWQKRFTRRIVLQATMVNVPDQKVEFPERKGVWSIGAKLTEAFGYKVQIFEPADIAAVIALGNEAT